MSKSFNLKLEYKNEYGTIFDFAVTLEGNYKAGKFIHDPGKNLYYKNINPYNIEDDALSVKLAIEGKLGASANLDVFIDGTKADTITCTITENSNYNEKTIPIP